MSAQQAVIPPQLPAAEAVKGHYEHQFEVIRDRAPAVRTGDDSKDLHRLRVAVRRTRSALDQLRGVLPEVQVAHFSDEFRWVQNSTGAARDADVFLARLGDYLQALPTGSGPALEPLRMELLRRRGAAYDDVRTMLDSPRYPALMKDWEEFLAGIRLEACPAKGSRPIRAVADHAIWKAWKRVRKRGKGVDADTPVRDVHRLRIACKKLRYLLEMFRPLYGDTELQTLIRPLKRLQDDLGDFHDLEVQQEALESMAVAERGAALPGTDAACAALVAELQRRQGRELASFAEEFEALTTGAPKEQARRLFKRKKQEAAPPAKP